MSNKINVNGINKDITIGNDISNIIDSNININNRYTFNDSNNMTENVNCFGIANSNISNKYSACSSNYVLPLSNTDINAITNKFAPNIIIDNNRIANTTVNNSVSNIFNVNNLLKQFIITPSYPSSLSSSSQSAPAAPQGNDILKPVVSSSSPSLSINDGEDGNFTDNTIEGGSNGISTTGDSIISSSSSTLSNNTTIFLNLSQNPLFLSAAAGNNSVDDNFENNNDLIINNTSSTSFSPLSSSSYSLNPANASVRMAIDAKAITEDSVSLSTVELICAQFIQEILNLSLNHVIRKAEDDRTGVCATVQELIEELYCGMHFNYCERDVFTLPPCGANSASKRACPLSMLSTTAKSVNLGKINEIIFEDSVNNNSNKVNTKKNLKGDEDDDKLVNSDDIDSGFNKSNDIKEDFKALAAEAASFIEEIERKKLELIKNYFKKQKELKERKNNTKNKKPFTADFNEGVVCSNIVNSVESSLRYATDNDDASMILTPMSNASMGGNGADNNLNANNNNNNPKMSSSSPFSSALHEKNGININNNVNNNLMGRIINNKKGNDEDKDMMMPSSRKYTLASLPFAFSASSAQIGGEKGLCPSPFSSNNKAKRSSRVSIQLTSGIDLTKNVTAGLTGDGGEDSVHNKSNVGCGSSILVSPEALKAASGEREGEIALAFPRLIPPLTEVREEKENVGGVTTGGIINLDCSKEKGGEDGKENGDFDTSDASFSLKGLGFKIPPPKPTTTAATTAATTTAAAASTGISSSSSSPSSSFAAIASATAAAFEASTVNNRNGKNETSLPSSNGTDLPYVFSPVSPLLISPMLSKTNLSGNNNININSFNKNNTEWKEGGEGNYLNLSNVHFNESSVNRENNLDNCGSIKDERFKYYSYVNCFFNRDKVNNRNKSDINKLTERDKAFDNGAEGQQEKGEVEQLLPKDGSYDKLIDDLVVNVMEPEIVPADSWSRGIIATPGISDISAKYPSGPVFLSSLNNNNNKDTTASSSMPNTKKGNLVTTLGVNSPSIPYGSPAASAPSSSSPSSSSSYTVYNASYEPFLPSSNPSCSEKDGLLASVSPPSSAAAAIRTSSSSGRNLCGGDGSIINGLNVVHSSSSSSSTANNSINKEGKGKLEEKAPVTAVRAGHGGMLPLKAKKSGPFRGGKFDGLRYNSESYGKEKVKLGGVKTSSGIGISRKSNTPTRPVRITTIDGNSGGNINGGISQGQSTERGAVATSLTRDKTVDSRLNNEPEGSLIDCVLNDTSYCLGEGGGDEEEKNSADLGLRVGKIFADHRAKLEASSYAITAQLAALARNDTLGVTSGGNLAYKDGNNKGRGNNKGVIEKDNSISMSNSNINNSSNSNSSNKRSKGDKTAEEGGVKEVSLVNIRALSASPFTSSGITSDNSLNNSSGINSGDSINSSKGNNYGEKDALSKIASASAALLPPFTIDYKTSTVLIPKVIVGSNGSAMDRFSKEKRTDVKGNNFRLGINLGENNNISGSNSSISGRNGIDKLGNVTGVGLANTHSTSVPASAKAAKKVNKTTAGNKTGQNSSDTSSLTSFERNNKSSTSPVEISPLSAQNALLRAQSQVKVILPPILGSICSPTSFLAASGSGEGGGSSKRENTRVSANATHANKNDNTIEGDVTGSGTGSPRGKEESKAAGKNSNKSKKLNISNIENVVSNSNPPSSGDFHGSGKTRQVIPNGLISVAIITEEGESKGRNDKEVIDKKDKDNEAIDNKGIILSKGKLKGDGNKKDGKNDCLNPFYKPLSTASGNQLIDNTPMTKLPIRPTVGVISKHGDEVLGN